MRANLIILVTLITCMHVAAKGYAQKVSLTVKNATLSEVLKEIKKQTDYDPFYDSEQIKEAKKITISIKNASLEEVLNQCLKGQPFTYRILNKTIVLTYKPPTSAPNPLEKFLRQKIHGKITDKENQPLVGVNVRVKGSAVGTVTDQAGYYTIEADEKAILIFSYVGFQTYEIKINNQSEINIIMVENTSELKETVVKGYYQTTKELNTGNVTTVRAIDLARQPISDPIVALQGRVPGLFIQQTSGVIGRNINVRLRGQNSLNNGNEPLYIVDGIPFISESLTQININGGTGRPVSPFNSLNINDIEKIEILKDADATAIYGSRGANGVILITTKKGISGSDKLDVNYYTGVGKIAQRMDLLNSAEYLAMRTKAFANDNVQPGTSDYDLNGTWDKTRHTDWQDLFIGGTSKVHDLQASLSGGNENTHYRIGGTYRRETTVYPGDFFGRKAGVLFNLNHQSKNNKLKVNFSANYVNNYNNLPTTDFTSNITLAPNAPEIYNPDGSLNWANQTWTNPMTALFTDANENSNNLITNFQVSYKILRGLELKTNLGYNKLDFQQNNITPFTAVNPTFTPNLNRKNQVASNKNTSYIIEPQLSYNTSLWKGDLNALIGSTILETNRTIFGESFTGFLNDALITNIAAASFRTVENSFNNKYKYNAVFARVGYTINERYILNLTGRRDGSSRFGPGKQFGNFGALGAAWIFSKENLIKNNISVLSFGKLRASYGTTGNDQIGDYAYLSTYIPYTPAYQGIPSLEPTQHTNPEYGWERVNKLEVALELGFFNDRLMLNANYYRNRTNNQLVNYTLPAITGFNSVKLNLPALLQNSGLEFELSADILKDKKLSWTANLNLTIPKNKLVSYPNIKNSSFATRYAVGEPLTLVYVYSYTGLDPETGLYTFKDLNKDGNTTAAFDREFYFIGQKFYGGLQNNLEYKRFQLNFLIQFTKQNAQDFNQNFLAGMFNGGNSNVPKSALENGRQELSQALSGLKRTRQNLFTSSSGLITDASYLRLKNVSLSWDAPLFKEQLGFIQRLRLYIQCQNLLTVTKYKGFDPELGRSASYGMPTLRMMTAGLQITL